MLAGTLTSFCSGLGWLPSCGSHLLLCHSFRIAFQTFQRFWAFTPKLFFFPLIAERRRSFHSGRGCQQSLRVRASFQVDPVGPRQRCCVPALTAKSESFGDWRWEFQHILLFSCLCSITHHLHDGKWQQLNSWCNSIQAHIMCYFLHGNEEQF